MFIRTTALAAACIYMGSAAAQEPLRPEAQLRFDEARQEAIADLPSPAFAAEESAAARPFAYKLNRRRTTEAAAYDAVTLWNVRKVKAKNRRMRLSDTTRREKVRLLKFFTERSRIKGVRPHLLGNVAGYTWADGVYDEPGHKWRSTPKHIAAYTLRDEYDSVRRAGGEVSMFKVPKELWRTLPPDAVYLLDGERVPGSIFQFIDGLILRTLEIYTDTATMARCGAGRGVVIGDIYPDRVPLVVSTVLFLRSIVAEDVPGRCLLGVGRRADALFLHASRRSRADLWRAGEIRCDLHRHRGVISARRTADDEELLPCTKARTKCAVPCRARSATTAGGPVGRF